MADDFEIVESTRGRNKPVLSDASKDKLAGAVADNFGRILDIADSMVRIKEMESTTENTIKLYKAEEEKLIAETKAYVSRLREETDSVVSKMDAAGRLLRDFYREGRGTLSGEEFSKVMIAILDKIEEKK